MTELSNLILSGYQIRKTARQKAAFIELMQRHIPGLHLEEGGRFPKNRNLILGDPEKAEFLLTAHYDTCVAMPLPNFLAPKNIPISLAYSVLIALPILIAAVLVNLLFQLVTDNALAASIAQMLALILLLYFMFFGGIPNKHNANDNSSGVITLIELIEKLPEEDKKRCAFVFFDNEELGLLGSAFYRKKHKNAIKKQLIINFDCVSDGEHMLFVRNKAAAKGFGAFLEEAYGSREGFTAHHESSRRAMYPSDQAGFPISVGVAACHRKALVGLYLNRIHTARDTVFKAENIDYLTASTENFLTLTREGKTCAHRNR